MTSRVSAAIGAVPSILLGLAACDGDGASAAPDTVAHYGHEHTTATPILDDDGHVAATGWARYPLFQFVRDDVPANLSDQIREWDFYAIHTPDFAIMITLAEVRFADLGHFVIASASLHDFHGDGQPRAQSLLVPDDGARLDLLPTSGGNYVVTDAGGTLTYSGGPSARDIDIDLPPLSGHLSITIPPDESMALVTPWPDQPGTFFYENKVTAMPVSGSLTVDGTTTYELPAGASFAVMDWVRAVTPHTLDWTWAVGVGTLDGQRVGLNLGSVFGDDTDGTADCVIIDGKLHQLPKVDWTTFDDVTKAWRFTSADGGVDLELEPNGYREVQDVDLGFYTTHLVKPYGTWRGTVTLDDGTRMTLDGLFGAAETNHVVW